MSQRKLIISLWTLAVGACLVLTAANLWFGDLNQDEGWYSYAARMVGEGKLPYRDFAFSQGPVFPFVYSLANPLVAAFGLAGSRLFTALLGLAGAACAALLALRLVPAERRQPAALIAFILVGVNVYQSYFTTVVKTYALSSLLLVLGFLALTFIHHRRGYVAAALSGALLALAAGTRLSAGVVLPVVFIFLVVRALRQRRNSTVVGESWRVGPMTAASFAIGAGITCCLVFLPFLIVARDSFLFWMVGYHSGRMGGTTVPQRLVHICAFVSRVVQAYFVPLALLVVVCVRSLGSRKDSEEPLATTVLGHVLWLSVILVTLVHMFAPFPYDDYQAMVFPLFAAALAVAVARLPRCQKAISWILPTIFVLSLASSFSSPINQAWVLRERDRIWWRVKKESPICKLRRVGRNIRDLSGPDGKILTQDTYLAVESGLSVPAGLEMGPFSYYPDMDTETARKLHVLNREMIRELLGTCDASVAAFSGYGLAIESPGVTELAADEQDELRRLVLEGFRMEDEIPHFGQALTTLQILARR